MRRLYVLALFSLVASCGRDDEPLRRADGSAFSSSGGEVALSDGSRLQFVITSERYKKWDAAQRALTRSVAARFGSLLQPAAPTERSIERSVAYLETNVAARQAIEKAGISVRDFVLMTVALDQEMRRSSGQVVGRARRTRPPDPEMPLSFDTSMTSRMDSMYRGDATTGDTVRADTARPDTMVAPRKDTVLAAPRRDTVVPRRDTVFLPSRRDTARDTARSNPPDSLSSP